MAKKVKKSKEYRKPAQFAAQPAPQEQSAFRAQMAERNRQGEAGRDKSSPMLLIVAGLVVGLCLFVYYHLLTMNQMKDLSDGLAMPDQRFFGYQLDDIEALRGAMDADASGQLNYLHKTAGLLFPLFTAVFSMLLFIRWVPNRAYRWLAWLAPLGFAVADIWENFAIDALFSSAPDASAVMLASVLTTVRWTLLATRRCCSWTGV